ncbi:nuclear transport factor 2 family protein, partial [Dietzia sp. NCCP-2495]|uniref:nuclear transport factor 2 family protein n=1 Tax=Dietzia sp. NCCP-2495 TaxID=2934675 RepID=UPI00222EEA2C
QKWVDANAECERNKDWTPLADFFTEDATYGWNYGTKDDFMAVGRDELRDLAFGQEMAGLGGWQYPYIRTIIDPETGDVLCLWKQIARDTVDPRTGRPYEVHGLGGSWFLYNGNQQWAWQRDFFDFGNVVDLFMRMYEADALTPSMKARFEAAGGKPAGWYRIEDSPATLWPVTGPTEV